MEGELSIKEFIVGFLFLIGLIFAFSPLLYYIAQFLDLIPPIFFIILSITGIFLIKISDLLEEKWRKEP